jgi:hypothetical protein
MSCLFLYRFAEGGKLSEDEPGRGNRSRVGKAVDEPSVFKESVSYENPMEAGRVPQVPWISC